MRVMFAVSNPDLNQTNKQTLVYQKLASKNTALMLSCSVLVCAMSRKVNRKVAANSGQ